MQVPSKSFGLIQIHVSLLADTLVLRTNGEHKLQSSIKFFHIFSKIKKTASGSLNSSKQND